MLEGLQQEIEAHPELYGASPRIVIQELNTPGSAHVEAWITAPTPVEYSMNTIYTYYISNGSLQRLVTFLAQPENAALALRFEKATDFDLSSPAVLLMLSGLRDAGVCTEDEYVVLVRLGQVRKSRAEELFGRKLTLEDF